MSEATAPKWRCANCGETFDVLDAARHHVVTNGYPIDPEEHIERVLPNDGTERSQG